MRLSGRSMVSGTALQTELKSRQADRLSNGLGTLGAKLAAPDRYRSVLIGAAKDASDDHEFHRARIVEKHRPTDRKFNCQSGRQRLLCREPNPAARNVYDLPLTGFLDAVSGEHLVGNVLLDQEPAFQAPLDFGARSQHLVVLRLFHHAPLFSRNLVAGGQSSICSRAVRADNTTERNRTGAAIALAALDGIVWIQSKRRGMFSCLVHEHAESRLEGWLEDRSRSVAYGEGSDCTERRTVSGWLRGAIHNAPPASPEKRGKLDHS